MNRMSVSVGRAALPAVKQAIEHARANRKSDPDLDHDPFIVLIVDDQGQQEITWQCYDCAQLEKNRS